MCIKDKAMRIFKCVRIQREINKEKDSKLKIQVSDLHVVNLKALSYCFLLNYLSFSKHAMFFRAFVICYLLVLFPYHA